MVVANPHARYVWRGQGNVAHTLHHSLHRRLGHAGADEDEAVLAENERRLIERARMAGYDRGNGRALTDVELVALLQHEGAATRFLDVTPDPFIALFFACEHAASTSTSAAVIALLVRDEWPIRPQLAAAPTGLDCLDVLDHQRISTGAAASRVYLVETAYLNDRMKAQRGQFLVSRLPTDPALTEWTSLDLEIKTPAEEQARIDRLLNPTPGAPLASGDRPPVILFRIAPHVRAAIRLQLAVRFGYTTETIYPDLNGFALAFNQFAPLT